ncbi:MAG: ComF family protein [Patescibacteria group bacterium]
MPHLSFTNWLMDIVLPKYCLGCGLEGAYLCAACRAKLQTNPGASCYLCQRRSIDGQICDHCHKKYRPWLKGLLVAADWDNDLLRQIIYDFKYRFVKELADPLASLLIAFLDAGHGPKLTSEILLVPVPLHPRRLAWRDFNQAELLSQKVAAYFNLPLEKNILFRQRHTPPQAEIASEAKRRANIRTAFFLKNNFSLQNKIVILVDDVSTTAATLEECARTLKPLGPKEIWGLVIARG